MSFNKAVFSDEGMDGLPIFGFERVVQGSGRHIELDGQFFERWQFSLHGDELLVERL